MKRSKNLFYCASSALLTLTISGNVTANDGSADSVEIPSDITSAMKVAPFTSLENISIRPVQRQWIERRQKSGATIPPANKAKNRNKYEPRLYGELNEQQSPEVTVPIPMEVSGPLQSSPQSIPVTETSVSSRHSSSGMLGHPVVSINSSEFVRLKKESGAEIYWNMNAIYFEGTLYLLTH